MEINSVNVVEKNPVPKSQTKPYYIGTKEAPSDTVHRNIKFCLQMMFHKKSLISCFKFVISVRFTYSASSFVVTFGLQCKANQKVALHAYASKRAHPHDVKVVFRCTHHMSNMCNMCNMFY